MPTSTFGFINPYAFLPVDFEKYPCREEVKTGTHSGIIVCKLITKTPLAIPDKVTRKDVEVCKNGIRKSVEHKQYSFMLDGDNQPMIPASSIRGPVRSMFEALTNSCFTGSPKDDVITYRTKRAFKPGLLHYDTKDKSWKLYKAVRYIFAVKGQGYSPFNRDQVKCIRKEDLSKTYCYGQKVNFSSGEKAFVTSRRIHTDSLYVQDIGSGLKVGYICIGDPFSKKHFESIFERREEIKEISADKLKEAVNKLDEIIHLYRDDKVNLRLKSGETPYRGRSYKGLFDGTEFLPIWYEIDNQNLHLAVASIGRSAYSNTMRDMLGDYAPCTDRNCACPACRLFGLIGDNGLGSRVRFTDAVSEKGEEQFLKGITLKELSSPKPSYTPFYLRRKNGTNDDDWSYDSRTRQLAGRKIYWHNPKATDNERSCYEESANRQNRETDRNATMDLLKTNQSFVFSVYYDRLQEEELKQLVWLLCLGENEKTGKYCYKIGHGKPLGLGSVKISITKITERCFSNEKHEYELKPKQPEAIIGSCVPKGINWSDECKLVTDFEREHKYPVSYPAVVNMNGDIIESCSNDVASHKWFGKNYQQGGIPRRTLPSIGRKDTNGLANLIMDGYDEGGRARYSWPDGFQEPPAAQATTQAMPPKLPAGVTRVTLLREPVINPQGKYGQNYMGFFSKDGKEIRVLNIPRRDIDKEILVREEKREGESSLFFYYKP